MAWMDKLRFKDQRVTAEQALPGRGQALPLTDRHWVLGTPLRPTAAELAGGGVVYFGMGCFWGAERLFWQLPGVRSTAVGYAGGLTPNPEYEEVCSGLTGHAEVVLVNFDPARIGLGRLLEAFWNEHDPTQGNRQGADIGTQYRSVIHCTTAEQLRFAEEARAAYQAQLSSAGLGTITTEIALAPEFYFAEDYHQQYLAKNPNGYCGLRGTGQRYCAPAPAQP